MVDADAVVPLPGAGLVVPEGISPRRAVGLHVGFGQAQVLPNNILVAYVPKPEDAIEALQIGEGGGGGPGDCASIRPAIWFFSGASRVGGPGVMELCNFPESTLEIQLKQPDGSLYTDHIEADAVGGYCFPGLAVLQDGAYELTVTGGSAVATFDFTLAKPDHVTVYFPESVPQVDITNRYCSGLVRAGSPTFVVFRGLEPGETRQVRLYGGQVGGTGLPYLNWWSITADALGNVVLYIQDPEIALAQGLDTGPASAVRYEFKIAPSDGTADTESSSIAGLGFLTLPARLETSPPPARATPTVTPPPDMNLNMWIRIWSDSFAMGARDDDPRAEASERPLHIVSLKEYWLQQHEVTNLEYAQCIRAGACTPPAKTGSETRGTYFGDEVYDRFPVIYVTQPQAATYCAWIGGRLPTEAEWERAARFPEDHLYPWADFYGPPNEQLANYGYKWGDTLAVTALGEYLGDPILFSHLAGNVWEWTSDWYDASFYSSSAAIIDPTGPIDGTKKVVRGGSFGTAPAFLRSSNRHALDPDTASASVGMRCARDTEP